jgi:DNA-binding response OmpR family regulator
VHISWLRQAIEEDPRNPRILKTIRGVGYRLDV